MKENGGPIFTIKPETYPKVLIPNIKVVNVNHCNTVTPGYTDNVAKDKERNGNLKDEQRELTDDKVSYWNGCYGIVMLLSCLISSSVFTIIPQHDVIKYPEYWYESIFTNIFGMYITFITMKILDGEMILGYPHLKSFRLMIILLLTTAAVYIALHCNLSIFVIFYYLI